MDKLRPDSTVFNTIEVPTKNNRNIFIRNRVLALLAGFTLSASMIANTETHTVSSEVNIEKSALKEKKASFLSSIGKTTFPSEIFDGNITQDTNSTTSSTTLPPTTTTTTPQPLPIPSPSGIDSGVNWDGIAQCETEGNWSMSGPKFSGGVGFANSTWSGAMHGTWKWDEYPDLGYPENAGSASREQQIVVAERVYDVFGLSGWGCQAHG